ncbi:hypothetical protein RZV17_00210 [Xanthomonas cannabis]|uniref:hypothetical protein n=1 Tax=Xanthomonas cannabis TaxID=1885674 RepID=UPI0033B8631D
MTATAENAGLPLTRFAAAVANGGFYPDPGDPANRGGYRGMLFCAVGSEDEALFAGLTKIPLPMVLVMTPIIQSLPAAAAQDAAVHWLQPRAQGMDDLAAERVIVDYLESSVIRERVAGHQGASQVHAALLRLHQMAASGRLPGQGEWRAVRKEATALLRGLEEHDAKVLSYLGTAAWPVRSAPEVIRDLLNDEAEARAAMAGRDRNLRVPTGADWDTFRTQIDELKASGKSKEEAFAVIDSVLHDRHPDVWERLTASNALGRETRGHAAQFMRALLDRQF